MPVNITIPSPGESITEVTLGQWRKNSGDWVSKDEPLVEVESDKVTLEISAPETGLLNVTSPSGAELKVGAVVGTVDPAASKPAGAEGKNSAKPSTDNAPARQSKTSSVAQPIRPAASTVEVATATTSSSQDSSRATSVARKVAADMGVNLAKISGTGPSGRVTKSDVLAHSTSPTSITPANLPVRPQMSALGPSSGARSSRREKMTKLRQRIAQRLVEAQHTAAMLTTFNEADMTEVMRLRSLYKESFEKTHGIGLGFMSFFAKAVVSALQKFPRVNAFIVGDEIEFHDFVDISVAVGTPKGLVVPIVRNAELMSFAHIELAIKDLALRARDGKLSIDEMTGGTFTISNGGVYGSLNSTPILNPPQSAILGLHAIKNRPVEDPRNPGQIVLRPMMYLALSYDHRIIDGSEAVSFLVHIKQAIESPERLLLGL